MAEKFPPTTRLRVPAVPVRSSLPAGITPGTIAARRAKFRPLSGSSVMVLVSTTCPSDEVSVWVFGAAPTTSTVSETFPTSSVKSTFKRSCTFRSMPLLLSFLKPVSSAVSS